MTIHECKEYGAGPCLNENLIGEIAEANATLADRIAALKAELEIARRPHSESWKYVVLRAEKSESQVAALESESAELRSLLHSGAKALYEIEQVLGKALGYPWYKDDPANFPSATEADGVCIGEHVAQTIADEAATKIAALEAENAALKAERDAYRSQFWDKSIPDLVEMRKQRDDARAAFNVMDGCYKQAVAERDSETRWAHHYFTAWQTARQSRARLVRLVRHMKAVRHTVIDLVCDTLHIWRPADDTRSELLRHERYALKAITTLRGELREAVDQRNDARAWAAAWRRAATFWRGWRDMPYTYCRDRDFVFGGARRAAEAAEAMDRR